MRILYEREMLNVYIKYSGIWHFVTQKNHVSIKNA